MAVTPERPPDPTPAEMFGDNPPDGERVPFRDKLAELKRELEMRRNVYPKLIERGQLSEETAARQIRILEAIVADWNIQPWPHTRNLVAYWRPRAESLTVLGIHAAKMHRDELLAVLAFAVEVMRRDGLLEPEKPNPEEPPK
jgi:hypothetical protein